MRMILWRKGRIRARALLLAAMTLLSGAGTADAADRNPPKPVLSLADGAQEVGVNEKIIITFRESVKHADGTAISSRNAHQLFSLDQVTGGVRPEVKVSWSPAKKSLTITPVIPLAQETGYRLAVPAGVVRDRSGNLNPGVDVRFTTEQKTGPLTVTVKPRHQSHDVPVDSLLTLSFNKPVWRANKTEIRDKDLASMVKLSDSKGKRVPFAGQWDQANRRMVLDPLGNLAGGETYTITLPAGKVIDRQGTKNEEVTSTFTTRKPVDRIPPTITSTPAHGATNVSVKANLVLHFAEEVVLQDGTPLSSAVVKGMVQLYDPLGKSVDYSASYNKSKRTLTVNARGDMQRNTTYTLVFPARQVKDWSGNENRAFHVVFSTGSR